MLSASRSFRSQFALPVGWMWVLAALSLVLPTDILAARPAWTTSRITGTPEPPEPYKIVSAFPQVRFQRPTSIEEIPNANRLLVTEMGGKVYSLAKQRDVREADLVLDLNSLLPSKLAGQSVSLFDAELHPKFLQNRFVYLCYVFPGEGKHTRVSRFTLTADAAPKLVPGSELVIITWPAGGHNAGCLEFGKDGKLLIATGDGTGPNPPDGLTTGQDVSDLLGAILRIDVDRATASQAYAIPADNPFIELKGARPEIWAYGLRNPWKFGVDPQTGDTFVADNGWESWEMIHRIVRGGNCGWPVMEGRAALRTEVKVGPTPILPPVKDHPHTEANSVIGGPVYRGKKLPELNGSFVYGDYITGTIWSIRPDADNSYSHTTLVDTDLRIVGFLEASGGELLVLDYDFSGQIYELAPSGLPDKSADFPRKLSQTGLFQSLEKLEPAAGVVPYDVVVPRWQDGAEAQRWIAIPGTGRVELGVTVDQPSVFPEGTVFVKQLSLPATSASGKALRLETQLLHFENGVWHPYSYLWDEAGRDAQLVESSGAKRTIQVADPRDKTAVVERTWHVNAVNECKLCHNAGPRFVLGFALNQLKGWAAGPSDKSRPQLTVLADQGVIAPVKTPAADDPLRLVPPHETNHDLNDRARSYLHANCSMCHHPGGNAIVSFFLRRDLSFEKLNTNKGTGIGTFGMQDAKLIVPGDPYRSVVMYRMSKLGYARMPYIGSHLVDSAGAALVEQWIRSLPATSADGRSAPLTEKTAEATALQTLSNAAITDRSKREQALRELVKTTSGALALTTLLHRGSLNETDCKAAVEIGGAVTTSDIRGLFETFVPESKRRPTLGTRIDPNVILSRTGDAARGKLIFFSDGARCRACHDGEDRGKSLGPTLQEMNKKYPRSAELLPHILQPSVRIDEPFVAYTVILNDGRVLAGLLVQQNDKEVAIKTAEKKVVRIPRSEIDSLQKSPKSLMPDNILSDLTAQEAADLIEYLRSVGVPK